MEELGRSPESGSSKGKGPVGETYKDYIGLSAWSILSEEKVLGSRTGRKAEPG